MKQCIAHTGKWAVIGCVALWLAGCASVPESRAFNRAAHGGIEVIDVLPMQAREVDLMIVNNPGYSFGLIGFGIAEANRIPKRNWLREQVATEKFDHLAVFRTRFTQAMEARGYQLRWPDPLIQDKAVKTARTDLGLRKQYVANGENAQLDLAFGFIGYASAGSQDNAPYRPSLVAAGKLQSADGRTGLFSEVVVYNDVFPFYSGKSIVIQPDAAFRYPDFDDLRTAGSTSVEGLRVAVEATADKLAEQFGAVK